MQKSVSNLPEALRPLVAIGISPTKTGSIGYKYVRRESVLVSLKLRKIYRTVTLRLNCIGSRSAASHIVTRDAMLSVDISISCLNEIDVRTDARFPG